MTASHPITRALERYGLRLSPLDLRDLARRCAGGEGCLGGTENGRRYHMLVWGERILHVIYKPASEKSRHGTIVTVMPPEVATYAAGRDHMHFARRKGFSHK